MNFYEATQNQRQEYLLKKWASRIADVEAVRRSEGRSFSTSEATRMAQLLESVDAGYRRAEAYRTGNSSLLNESDNPTQTSNVAHGLKLQTFDLITGVYPNLIAEDLVSIQPLTQKTGQIFYMKYIRKSNRGNLKAGSTLVDQFNVAGYEGKNYTSEIVEGEAHSLAEGQTEFYLDYAPIRPNTVTGLPEGATVDYATGRVSLSTPAVAGDIEVSYVQDLEYAPAQVPEIGIELRDTFVTARPRKLKSLFSLDAAYDLQMSQGVDLANTMLVAAANEFRHETDGDIIMDLYNRAGLTSTWADDFVVGSGDMGVSRRQQAQTFADEIHIAATNIFQVTKRVVGNYVVVGKKGMDLLTIIGAPRFVAAGSITAGPHFAGTLDGNIKVYYSPFLPQNNYLVGYKGDSLVDAGYVYAPYMMFYATELLMMDDFVGRRGYATSYGKRMLEPNLYVKGTITGKAAYTN